MQRSVVIGQTRRGGPGPWWSRLPVPLQPASSGPVRYWQDRGRLAAKCALAAVAAWVLARYAAGQHDPYFAPLAALAGVSSTVARSLREGIQYVAGFVLGAVLAIPVAVVLGPSIAGIVAIVLAGVVIGSWRRLGGQSTQVTFTALFVLLIGGYQPLHYLTPRLIDVGIGVVTGLAVNVLVFPPLQLRPAEHAVRQWGDDVAAALDDLADAAAGLYSPGQSWPRHEHDHLDALGPALEDHGRAVSASLRAATWYRHAQRATDRRRATTALRLAVEADPAFELARADLDAITGTSGQRHGRRQMNWERHHIEIVRTAASGNDKRAADLLREHLAGVGCDPLAFRIVAQMRQPAGMDDDFENLAGQLPDCHPTRWPTSP
jgi:uncharacterized membrane protein YccC